MKLDDATVNVRVLIDGAALPLWRVRLLGLVARILGVPLRTETP
jgi:hypothetical protein